MSRLLILIVVFIVTVLAACDEPFAPKPRGYFRIELPEKKYQLFQPESCPFNFDIPAYAQVRMDTSSTCWMNVEFPAFKGTLYLSYKPVSQDLDRLVDDCRSMAMKHTAKASAIEEEEWSDPENKVYGLKYTLKGNSASPTQFWLTDSLHHFIRGSFYFYARPNPDSLAPVMEFLGTDIDRIMDSFRWK